MLTVFGGTVITESVEEVVVSVLLLGELHPTTKTDVIPKLINNNLIFMLKDLRFGKIK